MYELQKAYMKYFMSISSVEVTKYGVRASTDDEDVLYNLFHKRFKKHREKFLNRLKRNDNRMLSYMLYRTWYIKAENLLDVYVKLIYENLDYTAGGQNIFNQFDAIRGINIMSSTTKNKLYFCLHHIFMHAEAKDVRNFIHLYTWTLKHVNKRYFKDLMKLAANNKDILYAFIRHNDFEYIPAVFKKPIKKLIASNIKDYLSRKEIIKGNAEKLAVLFDSMDIKIPLELQFKLLKRRTCIKTLYHNSQRFNLEKKHLIDLRYSDYLLDSLDS